jgi:hypothetical protein
VDEQNVLTFFKNADKLGRDIHARMEARMNYMRRIEINLELLERNNGIISPFTLRSHDIIDDHYIESFRGEDTKEVCFFCLCSHINNVCYKVQYVYRLIPSNISTTVDMTIFTV